MFTLQVLRPDDRRPNDPERDTGGYGRLLGFCAVFVALYGIDTLVLDNAAWVALRDGWDQMRPGLDWVVHAVRASIARH